MIESDWFARKVEAVRTGILQPQQWADGEPHAQSGNDRSDRRGYDVLSGGIAVIDIVDQITRGESSYGGTSSVMARRAIREAVADADVSGIMLYVNSPGGTVGGIDELAEEVRAAANTKPVWAHVEDLGASAAYWVASQADRISVNKTGQVGSIGTFAVLVDSSGAAEADGIQVHVISTGPLKGAGVPGTEITEEQIASLQRRVDGTNRFFLEAVASGRGVPIAQVREDWGTGEVWLADEARILGLVDEVESWESAISTFRDAVEPPPPATTRRTRAAIAVEQERLRQL